MTNSINGDLLAIIERAQKAQQARAQVLSIGTTNPTTSDRSELERCGIYKRYRQCTFTEMEKRIIPAQVREKYADVKRYADNLPSNLESGTGLILKGPVGTMKTSMAVAILQHHMKNGGSGLFVPMVSLLDNIFTLKERNKEEWVRYEERIKSTGLLVLDDLGAEYHQDWVLSKVDAIITERYNRMKPVVVTTNLSDSELKGKYSERIIDRLRSTAKVINFSGRSLREAAV